MFRRLISIGGVACAVAFASQAGALTVSSFADDFPCATSQFTTSTACDGAFAGNDSNQNLDGLFGINGWDEIAKVDVENSSPLTVSGLTLSGGGQSGTWSYDPGFGAYASVMGVVKAGDNFVSYLLDTSFDEGSWNTEALRVGNLSKSDGSQPAVSHVSLFGVLGDDPGPGPGPGPGPNPNPNPTPVPLPAAGWMLLAALGGMAFWRRRATA